MNKKEYSKLYVVFISNYEQNLSCRINQEDEICPIKINKMIRFRFLITL